MAPLSPLEKLKQAHQQNWLELTEELLAPPPRPSRPARPPRPPQPVTVEGEQVRCDSPEGQQFRLGLPQLLDLINPQRQPTVLPDGVKLPIDRGSILIWVHQTPPRVHSFRWIAEDSPVGFGDGATYRVVRIGLPYVIVFSVFAAGRDGRLKLTSANECFFRNEPLVSPDDQLCYPALLNCSKFPASAEDPRVDDATKPLSWICTQHMRPPRMPSTADNNQRARSGLEALLSCLFDTGFNYSSEHHEESSWFTESRKVDPRIATVENWQTATAEDPLFALEVPWLPVGKSVGQVAERILRRLRRKQRQVTVSDDLVRLIVNHGEVEKEGEKKGEEE